MTLYEADRIWYLFIRFGLSRKCFDPSSIHDSLATGGIKELRPARLSTLVGTADSVIDTGHCCLVPTPRIVGVFRSVVDHVSERVGDGSLRIAELQAKPYPIHKIHRVFERQAFA